MALLEGLASGLSVIATPVGAHSEVVTDGKTGLLVPPGDSAALAAALARLVNDSDFRRGLGERGRQLFLSRYSISAYITALDALYAGLGGSDRHIGNDHSPEVSRK